MDLAEIGFWTRLWRKASEFAEENKIPDKFNENTRTAGKDCFTVFSGMWLEITPREPEGLSQARCEWLNKEEVTDYYSIL